ncbi:hypothetical protein EC991_011341 [Linnemannia zychae]|nr:hypothetical protein EC991_011341 [Linnemannia zychae]
MGFLDFACLTADADATTFYGIAYADKYSADTHLGRWKYNVLVKSNSNPSSPSDLTWTVISIFDASKLTGYNSYTPYINQQVCAISEQGVFTVFGYSTGSKTDSKDSDYYGFQYNPAAPQDPEFNVKGSGTWTGITIDPAHKTMGSSNKPALGYVNNGGSKVLVHALLTFGNNTISLATVNESTNTLTAFGFWELNDTEHGRFLDAATIANNHLYVYGERLLNAGFPPHFTALPLAPLSPTTPVNKIYKTAEIQDCFHSTGQVVSFHKGSAILLCPQSDLDNTRKSTMYTIKDPDNAAGFGPPTTFPNMGPTLGSFVAIGGETGTSPSSFALMRSSSMDYYALGTENGAWYARKIEIEVSDPIGVNPVLLGRKPISSDSSSGSKAGLIGGVVGGVVLLVVVFGVWWVRRKKNNKSKDSATAAPSVADDKEEVA